MLETINLSVWLLLIVALSMFVGGYIGFGIALRSRAVRLHRERMRTLGVVQAMLQRAQSLSDDVDTHEQTLSTLEKQLHSQHLPGEFEAAEQTFLAQLAHVLSSNRQLAHELLRVRYQLQRQAQQLDQSRREARTDTLSGVGNRKAFEEHLEFLLSNLKHRGEPFALLLFDVDHFKQINDTRGHQAGDQVITILGQVLQSLMRPSDDVSRVGGDEFAILLADAEFEKSQHAAERIRQQVAQTEFDGRKGNSIAMTFSMGLTSATEEDTIETLLARADAALYQAKREGRNTLRYQAVGNKTIDHPQGNRNNLSADDTSGAASDRITFPTSDSQD